MMGTKYITGIALSPRKTKFGPVMFSGRLKEGLEAVSSAGFKFVELNVRSTDDLDPVALNQQLSALSLNVSAVATGQACLFDQLCFGSTDENQRIKAVAHFKRMASFAKEIHSGAIIIGGMRGLLSENESEYQSNYNQALAAIRECAEWTESIGITLLIEPINRYEINWLFTAEDGCKFLDAIGVKSVKLLLDTFHMNIEESNSVDAIIKAADRVGYIHFADNNRLAPGQGQTNFKEILFALEKINFSGPIIAEVLPLPDDLTAIKNTAKFWEDMSLLNFA